MAHENLWIEVAYASETTQKLLKIQVPIGTTAREAVFMSPLVNHFPAVDFHALPLGIFSRKVADDTPLKAGDRVEIYRPLLIDPKENRRRKAKNTARSQHGKTST